MTLACTHLRNRALPVFFIVTVCFLSKFEAVLAFQHVCNFVSLSANPSSTRIDVSVSSPSGPEVVVKKDPLIQFREHLQDMLSQVKQKPHLSFYMDDDLKRMEIQYYNLNPDEAPECVKEKPEFSYDGPPVRPDANCYEIVTHAYAVARGGGRGAMLAEDVARRYESRFEEQEAYATRYIMKGVVRAFIDAKEYDKAYELLQCMEDRFTERKDIELAPDTRMYNILTEGLSRFGAAERKYCANMTSTILEGMRQRYVSGQNPIGLPNRYTYTHVMHCNARVGKGVPTFTKLLHFYRQLQDDYQKLGYDTLKPDAISALPLFQVTVNSRGNFRVFERAIQIYDELQDLYAQTGDSAYRPVESIYKHLFTSAARIRFLQSDVPRMKTQIDDLISSMKSDIPEPSVYTMTTAINAKISLRTEESAREAEDMMRNSRCIDSVAYQTLIKGYARVGNAGRALELLDELKQLPIDNKLEVSTLGSIIEALSKASSFNKNASFTKVASQKAEKLLRQIVSIYQNGEFKQSEEKGIDARVFDSVLRLMGGKRGRATQIVAVLNDLQRLNELFPKQFNQTSSTIPLAIDALARCGDNAAPQKVLALLKSVEEPNVRVLASALSSISKANCRGVARKTEDLFEQIIERCKLGDRSASVNARTLTTAISTILKAPCPDATERAQIMIRKAIELGRNNAVNLSPNTICFNSLMNGFARNRESENAWSTFEEMKALHSRGYNTAPDVITYACVARAVARDLKSERAVGRLDKIVQEVQYNIDNGNLKPDTQLYNTLIKSYSCQAKNDESIARKANDLLYQLESSPVGFEGVEPDMMTYRNACEAFASCKAPYAANLAIDIFHKAEKLSRDGMIGPLDSDIISWTILAQTRSDAYGDALPGAGEFVRDMESSYQRLLNTRCYNTLLAAYANSAHNDRISRGVEIFEKLVSLRDHGQRNCEPDTSTYNWLILAAANSHARDADVEIKNFEFALKQFKTLHKDDTNLMPDSLTYEFFLRACQRLLPPGKTRTKLVGKALLLCSKGGLVTAQICMEAAKSDFDFVLGRLDTTEESRTCFRVYIPGNWCRKVPHRRRQKEVELAHLRGYDIGRS